MSVVESADTALRKAAILVVEDDARVRTLIRTVLIGFGVQEICGGLDGTEGLDVLKSHSPDIIITDWDMAPMDGLTFVKNVRQQGIKTPIIMVTTESEKARVIEAIKAGVNNYVVKPFTPEQLSERVNETMAKAAAA